MCILIVPILHGFIHQSDFQFFIHLVIGKTLAKVDGFVFIGQHTHYGKNGSAYFGQFAFNGRYQQKVNLKIRLYIFIPLVPFYLGNIFFYLLFLFFCR